MVSSFQCLDEVIAVGNYTNRNHYIDYDTLPQSDVARIPGNLFSSSSHGPARGGRIKPDIAAPGDWTMSALVTTLKDDNLAFANNYLMAPGGFHMISGGTSCASPGVAGIAALYLQMQPNASWLDVKNAILNCARADAFTGNNLPDNFWGYGKADAFAAMTGCATSVNNNQNTEFELITVYPNPSSEEVNIVINLYGNSQNGELIIYDLVGKKIKTIKVKNSEHILLKKGTLQNGIYFCTLRDENEILMTKKLVISE
jgi:subtilisin family serine protease